jgi:CRISPR/Cas system CMR subunit Cmr6 (Cas7 group RAMP superfamily)
MAIKTDTFTGGGGGAVTGGLVYKGAFDATAGTPSIANAEQGDFYVIDTAGTIYGKTWAINDHLLINADMGGSITNSKIDKIDNTEPTNVLITTNNLSDLDNATTARTNLGLGNVATLDTGVANGNVIIADATGLPAIDGSQLTGVTSTDSTKLAIANNLSDLNNATTARTNLGLGNVATLDTGVANGNVIIADATGLPVIDGSQLTGITSTDSTKLAILNNLSDLNNAVTARTNLGLGNVATLDTGVGNGDVIVADATGLPVIDGSQLTGITATDSTKLAILNNLSDLNNAVTARTNLGLGNVATLDTGVGNGDVIVADATGLPAIDGSQLLNLPSGGLSAIVQDTTPQLGGDLDVNGQSITSAGNANVTINPAGTGDISVGADLIPDVDATHSLGDETYRFVSYYGDMNGAIRFKAKNDQGGAITKGQVVFISGVSGTVPEVQLARANSALTMPAFGLALNNANDQAEVQIITFGNLTDYNTTTYSLSANDTVYVSSATAGALTNTAPTGEANLIQNIGRVVRADASAGIIKVGGAGRSNATPNLDTDKIFLGNGSNQAVSTALSSINVSSLNDDLSYLVPANNLSDLNNATTARTNLGLGNVATLDTGVANGNVIIADATGLPAIDGSQLLNLPSGGGFTYSAIIADPANAQANYHYSCGAGNQTFTVTLPTSGISAGAEIRIKNMGTGTITIDPQTQTIDGVTTDYVLDVQYSAITLVSTGSNWELI